MRRREFITLVGGVAAAWPLVAYAQQPKRRIGVLMSGAADDREMQARLAAFLDGLQKLGWTDGLNLRIDTRWLVGGDADRSRSAEELVGLGPDVILASASANVAALQRITRSVPIVFANVIDPVGAGSVASLARPGGNTTGFSAFEYSLAENGSNCLNNEFVRSVIQKRCPVQGSWHCSLAAEPCTSRSTLSLRRFRRGRLLSIWGTECCRKRRLSMSSVWLNACGACGHPACTYVSDQFVKTRRIGGGFHVEISLLPKAPALREAYLLARRPS